MIKWGFSICSFYNTFPEFCTRNRYDTVMVNDILM